MPPRMAQTNVSSCVISIIASFTSGLDVFKKFQESRRKKKRKSKKNASVDDEESSLARSLRQGPEDIGREYQRSIHVAGDQFAHGDGVAQTALAEILLKLNTGLVSIIDTFLTRDKRDTKLDCHSLTSLSERSRTDTCRTLRQLYRRMMQLRIPPSISTERDRYIKAGAASNLSASRKRQISNPKPTKVRGPMLAKVVIADSNRPSQVAMVRPGERKKKSGSSLSSNSPKIRSDTSLALQAPELPSRPPNQRSQTVPEDRSRPQRKHSAIDFNQKMHHGRQSDLRATQSTPRLATTLTHHEPIPPVPDTAPLPIFQPRRRKPTPTFYSIESDATKLGEIPMHKWAEPYDFDAMSRLNREAEMNGWPIRDLDGHQQQPTKRRGLFRLFRRS